MLDTPGEVRDWRQVAPLAFGLGAAFGALLRPRSAVSGALVGVFGLIDFALIFAAGHALIEGSLGAFGEGLMGVLRAIWLPALVLLPSCALAGAALGRSAPEGGG